MLSLTLPVEIFLCVEPTDMRKGFDGLVGLVQTQLGATCWPADCSCS